MKLERRVITVGNLEVRQRDDGSREYRGDAIRFGEPSENLGGFIEYVDADCEIQGDDVRHLINHDPNLVLGRTTAGTTRLSRSGAAVSVSTDMPDTSYARDLEVSIERRDVTQMSFGFRALETRADGSPGQVWDFTQSPAVRHLRAIDVADVSTVTYPAYPTTTAEVRSLVAEHAADHVRSIAEVRAAMGFPPIGAERDSAVGLAMEDGTVDVDQLAALKVLVDSMQASLEAVDALLGEFDPELDPDTAPGGDDSVMGLSMNSAAPAGERRAGKKISADNAQHIQAVADAYDAMGDHLKALVNAADLSNDAGVVQGEPGGDAAEGANSLPSDAELRLYEALENVMHVKSEEGR